MPGLGRIPYLWYSFVIMTLLTTDTEIKEQVFSIFRNLNQSFSDTPIISIERRIQALKHLEKHILDSREKISQALQTDFRKPSYETDTSEILTCLIELRIAIRNLRQWIKPQLVKTPLELTGTKHYIRYEPKGVVLIISPWNYPVHLSLMPLIAAWSAGNRVVLKPSEYCPNCALVIKEIVEICFSDDEVTVVNGDHEIAEELVALPFHHIYFTGSANTAKKVLHAAANNLTPVTLELGGKTPVLIDGTVSIPSIIKDVVYAKCLNAGQSCVAPDFILLPEGKQEIFAMEWNNAIRQLYGNAMLSNPDYCGIIHEKHYRKLLDLVQECLDQGAQTIEPIEHDPIQRKLKPILLLNSQWHHASMQDEIFGPVLPVIEYNNIQDVILQLRKMNRPLTLYVFSRKSSCIRHILDQVRSGGVTVNNCLLNYCNFHLPFGGDLQSGHGFNHGKFGFETFSHKRSISIQGKFINPLRFFYPPFDAIRQKTKNIAIKILGKV